MINTTKGELVFLQTGDELHASVLAALLDASNWVLQAYGLQDIELSAVTTKTYLEAALPAHIERYILRDSDAYFDEQYVKDVFAFTNVREGHCPPNQYAAVTRSQGGYRKSYQSLASVVSKVSIRLGRDPSNCCNTGNS